jgi:hypothetical protein
MKNKISLLLLGVVYGAIPANIAPGKNTNFPYYPTPGSMPTNLVGS